jgi:hypothetical protein
MLLRALLIWMIIALAEVGQGWLRIRLLNRRVGDRRARQLGVFTGSALFLFITWLMFPWLGASTTAELLGVGAFWLGLMLAFDFGFGRLVFRVPWERILREFDLRQGGLLGIGMLLLLLSPWLVSLLH